VKLACRREGSVLFCDIATERRNGFAVLSCRAAYGRLVTVEGYALLVGGTAEVGRYAGDVARRVARCCTLCRISAEKIEVMRCIEHCRVRDR